jgi:dTDP-4-amino-4,6-dideoxygalactose transaminase
VCNNILSLPCYHTLKTDEQDYIIQSIKDFYNEN